MGILSLFCLCVAATALRKRRAGSRSTSWTTRTDANWGTCASYMDSYMPVYFPLWCTGDATNLVFRGTATGELWPRLRLSIDDIDKGYREFPFQSATRTWEVTHDSLSAGLHIVRYSGDRLEMNELVVSGDGGTCSLDAVAGYDPLSYLNVGMDVITRVVGPQNGNFSEVAKRGLYFSSEVLGKSDDNTISALAMAEGSWQWFFEYSKEQLPDDEWLSNGRMFDESDLNPPFFNVSLDQFAGRAGEEMVVAEPCNTISNIVFSEAAVWLSCKNLPFGSEDMATVLGTLHAVAGGSTFMHASATDSGHLGDVMPIKVMMLEMHQIMAKSLVSRATGLTQAEQDAVVYLRRTGLATDHARTLTALFREPFSASKWFSVGSALDLPPYELSIAAAVVLIVEALDGKAEAWQTDLANSIIDGLLDSGLVPGDDMEWLSSTFRPAVAKIFDSVSLCADVAQDTWDMLMRFALTFLEAFIYQEEVVPVPQWVRDLVSFLSSIGIELGRSEMVDRWDYYNGERAWCEARSAHGTWHEKAAHGLIHMANVAAIILTSTNC